MRKTLTALAILLGFSTAAAAHDGERFRAHLTGGDLAGNVIDTRATGQAELEVIDNDTAIRFSLNVAGLANLFMAHIHVAAQGPVAPNRPVGPVVFWFVPTTPPAAPAGYNVGQTIQGDLASGIIMTDMQIVGPLTFDSTRPNETGVAGLLKAIREQRATIVVHTNDLDPATPAGRAGDSPAGEIRGLIQ